MNIKPIPHLPKPLVEPLSATVGLVIPPETRRYKEKETRFGTEWTVDLGPGEVVVLEDTFRAMFKQVEEFKDVPAARGSGRDLQAVFETKVDQYSFVTARETNGRYYAVTLRYRINLYTPKGEKVDSYTLTGYGNALALGMSGGKPLEQATLSAMRDAAAKFLVQFPQQGPGQQLARSETIKVDEATNKPEGEQIEAVPIDEAPPAG